MTFQKKSAIDLNLEIISPHCGFFAHHFDIIDTRNTSHVKIDFNVDRCI